MISCQVPPRYREDEEEARKKRLKGAAAEGDAATKKRPKVRVAHARVVCIGNHTPPRVRRHPANTVCSSTASPVSAMHGQRPRGSCAPWLVFSPPMLTAVRRTCPRSSCALWRIFYPPTWQLCTVATFLPTHAHNLPAYTSPCLCSVGWCRETPTKRKVTSRCKSPSSDTATMQHLPILRPSVPSNPTPPAAAHYATTRSPRNPCAPPFSRSRGANQPVYGITDC